MRLNRWMTFITAGLVLTGNAISAGPPPAYEQLQVPQCLAAQIKTSYSVLAENSQFKIINVPAQDVEKLIVIADRAQCGHFINVSHKFSRSMFSPKQAAQRFLQQSVKRTSATSSALATHKPVYEIKHQDVVNTVLREVVADNIWQTLTHLTTYHNRSATKESGVEAAKWLKGQFEKMAVEYDRNDTSTFFVNTGWYKQPSLVTVIGKDIKAPAIVLGAHMDTLDGHMPGAGDDGSGSSSLMEAARILLATKTTLKRPVYIIWYAAEERGLVGSQYVVEYFQDKSIPVKAAIQFDMTGYRVKADDPTMWVYTDYTDKGLSNFVAKLIDTYLHVPVDYSICGYGCSDHASWTDIGVPSAFPCESNFEEHNPNIHTSADTMEHISLEHMTNFSKLAVAFAIELASE
jgi:bacterial leucyl aminopeptidase